MGMAHMTDEFDNIFKVNKDLNIAMPVMRRENQLKQDLVETDSRFAADVPKKH